MDRLLPGLPPEAMVKAFGYAYNDPVGNLKGLLNLIVFGIEPDSLWYRTD